MVTALTWLTSLMLAVIAGIAAWIAFQQWVVARQKLNHDLFERRFAVYTAAQNHLTVCLSRNGGTREDTTAFYEATRAAPFLFESDINEFLAALMKHSVNIQVFSEYVDKPHLPEWQNYLNMYHTSQQWAVEALGKLAETFQPSLNLSIAKVFSINKIISISDAETLRKKITTIL